MRLKILFTPLWCCQKLLVKAMSQIRLASFHLLQTKTDGALMMAYSGVWVIYTARRPPDIIIPAGEYTIYVVGDVGLLATIRQRKN